MDRDWLRTRLGVFLVLLASYAYFWHSRDWNTASRLMLTYSLVDRGSLAIDGLENQTGDRAYFRGRYFSDKLPGYPLLATLPYAVQRVLGARPHPLNGPALAFWPSDYGITLATSGLLTAAAAVVLMGLARDLGASRRAAVLFALAYGLATPAYVYATLAYGHQASAFALLSSFALLARPTTRRDGLRTFLAGLLASYAAVIELQVGPVSAVLGFYLLGQCAARARRWDAIAYFGLGALLPALVMLLYNMLAFGNPLDMGYFHHATAQFAKVHSRENPLGLGGPDWSRLVPLLWGRYRGLLFYAPILALAAPGWIVLFAGRRWGYAVVSLAASAAVLGVNLAYPEWTGGWSTGPRLLVPLLPFAMIPVAAVLTASGRWGRLATAAAIGLGFCGAVLMLLFQGVGARLPQDVADPLVEVVWPLWRGLEALPRWWTGERFTRNLGGLAAGGFLDGLPASWQWVQFLPLVAFQVTGAAWMLSRGEPAPASPAATVSSGC
ncbi:hypothetical protein [Paludisphaera mucosa]|uniref:Glycosyltransferase RgtA/B/C/D-like domain-containing protein n=1 Tax=Paludisphaera mucosa TaxID=3030827 RepID=A0ABT6FFD6_9BACT|nr:hypothetical protein [Paludisphaera mucosa]MDG3006290.1 hypothetical protein [Paludisphaera mucosa]